MSDWISVKKRLPKEHEPVLCCFSHWNVNVPRQTVMVHINEDDCSWRVWDLGDYYPELSYDFNVTHWMPLPEPPKKDES